VIVEPGDRPGAATRRHTHGDPALPASAPLADRYDGVRGDAAVTPALLFLSTSDTDLLLISRVAAGLPADYGPIEAHNPARLDEAQVAALAGSVRSGELWAVAMRLLGGRRAFPAGLDMLRVACAASGTPLAAWPGEGGRDLELEVVSTVPPDLLGDGAAYLEHGGLENASALLRALSDHARGTAYGAEAPRPMPRHGVYQPGVAATTSLDEWRRSRRPGRPVVAVGFYRAHWMSANTEFVDALCRAIDEAGGEPLAFFCASLREPGPDDLPAAVADILAPSGGETPICEALILTLSFSVAEVAVGGGGVADAWTARWLERLDVPVVQAIVCTSGRDAWAASAAGLTPLDVAMQVALPEFDGRITGPPVCFKEQVEGVPVYVPDAERCSVVARLAVAHARLRHRPNREKRLAIVLSSYPTRNARVGNAVGLDTPASALVLLRRLRDEGYEVGELPADGTELIHRLIEAGVYDREYLTSEQLRAAAARQPVETYAAAWGNLPPGARQAVAERWGAAPGDLYVHEGHLHFAGLSFGRVLLTVQPPRGFGEHMVSIYHDPTLPPTHQYTAFYRWLEEDFGADAVVHLGKHGTLEWLPGKAVGLSRDCFPDALLPVTPVVYPFIVNDPGEGVQAKRRGHSVIVDHLIPPMTRAESYGELAQLEQLMDEYYHVQTLDPSKLPRIQDRIWVLVQEANLHRDLGEEHRPTDFDGFVLHMDGYLCELKDAQIRGGLHVLGQPPEGQPLVDLLLELTRRGNEGVPGLREALEAGGDGSTAAVDAAHELAGGMVSAALGDGVEAALRLLPERLRGSAESVERSLRYVVGSLAPRLERTTEELDSVVRALAGRHVPAGPSGAPTRGMAHVLPTGRNFYTVDPKSLPSPVAYEVGGELAEALLAKYVEDEGAYPETVGIVAWGTSAMRTHGDDIAEALHLLGVRPTWDVENRRVTGLQMVPLAELGRPRIDVVLRMSGFFRDAFANLVQLVDEAIELVATLDEPDDANYVARHFREEVRRKRQAGIEEEAARRTALYRIFASPPGTYGTGIPALLESGEWRDVADLARAYEAWGAYAYSRSEYGVDAVPEFRQRFSAIAVAVKNQDNREHDILDSDDYLQFHGGMIATVRALTGQAPRQYHGDSADPSRVRVRELRAEVRRTIRTRAVNPKWVQAMMRHGYKGGFELAATTDYLFGYDATAGVGEDWMYEGIARQYALEPEVQAFLREKNPWALMGIVRRLLEAAERHLWERPPDDVAAALRRLHWELDAYLEGWRDRRLEGDGRAAESTATR
jgi:cobaltochelatase CobN